MVQASAAKKEKKKKKKAVAFDDSPDPDAIEEDGAPAADPRFYSDSSQH